jgi:hypothetical protein
MGSESRKALLLGLLLIVLAALVYRAIGPLLTTGSPPSVARTRAGAAKTPGTPDLGLASLNSDRGSGPLVRRNLFRFDERRAGGDGAAASVKALPPQAPLPPPVRPASETTGLKLIGIVDATETSARVAVLSDGRGVYHGYEGDIIEGQFRILGINDESVEVSRLDSQTREVIRLPGAAVP